jgi:hypothetical protein
LGDGFAVAGSFEDAGGDVGDRFGVVEFEAAIFAAFGEEGGGEDEEFVFFLGGELHGCSVWVGWFAGMVGPLNPPMLGDFELGWLVGRSGVGRMLPTCDKSGGAMVCPGIGNGCGWGVCHGFMLINIAFGKDTTGGWDLGKSLWVCKVLGVDLWRGWYGVIGGVGGWYRVDRLLHGWWGEAFGFGFVEGVGRLSAECFAPTILGG